MKVISLFFSAVIASAVLAAPVTPPTTNGFGSGSSMYLSLLWLVTDTYRWASRWYSSPLEARGRGETSHDRRLWQRVQCVFI